MSLYRQIYRIVAQIPYGKVISYGAIANMLGCTARNVGYAMASIPAGQDLPWYRVVNSKGEISLRKHGHGDLEQKRRLLEEGVSFDSAGRIDLERYGWRLNHDLFDNEKDELVRSAIR
ncbi:MAG: MGMT family protein [Gammaproteobacteria bacterium]|nr:MGMT family protein [Gammaproteobacteria bacterium]MCY4218484.1 MGMT family protein [Gammaproteobacteria bacterium]MCY4275138.1 MGMT family protein [Gammaproteobacteria bacterium]